jgi:hypothetical protein
MRRTAGRSIDTAHIERLVILTQLATERSTPRIQGVPLASDFDLVHFGSETDFHGLDKRPPHLDFTGHQGVSRSRHPENARALARNILGPDISPNPNEHVRSNPHAPRKKSDNDQQRGALTAVYLPQKDTVRREDTCRTRRNLADSSIVRSQSLLPPLRKDCADSHASQSL